MTNCTHTGNPVRVGPYEVRAGGTWYLRRQDFARVDAIIPLNGKEPDAEWYGGDVFALPLPDFGGVPDNWREILETEVIPLLEQVNTLLAFCTASHGRTGTFLASLIALLESSDETPDPIQAVRERHCSHAVESLAQAEAIFALRGEDLPNKYR